MHTPVLFEHPLNEKMRTWLRIEFYFSSSLPARPLPATRTLSIFSAIPAIYWTCWNAAKCVPIC